MSGVASCKKEMGFGAYDYEITGVNVTTTVPPAIVEEEEESGTTSTAAATTTTELIFVNPGDSLTETDTEGLNGEDGATTTVSPTTEVPVPDGATTSSTVAPPPDTTTTISATTTEVPVPLPPVEGPYTDENVRIILYGISSLDTAALNRWTTLTGNYFEQFFNDYDEEEDVIRSNITDMFVELSNVDQEVPPEHEFNPLTDQSQKRNNLRRQARRIQVEVDAENAQTMISFDQSSSYRSSLDVLNDDPQLITRRPLETPEYRAAYVTYLRSIDFDVYGDLTFVSHMLYTDFPTPAPSPSPVEPGLPTMPPNTDEPTTAAPVTDEPTAQASSDIVCNLCKPGQYGVNADIIWDGTVSSCVDICEFALISLIAFSCTLTCTRLIFSFRSVAVYNRQLLFGQSQGRGFRMSSRTRTIK